MIVLFFTIFSFVICEGILVDFDSFKITPKDDIPDLESSEWVYTTTYTNPYSSYYGFNSLSRAGFLKNVSRSNSVDYIRQSLITMNSDHMGWETYGYLEISNKKFVTGGRSLRYVVTGGKNKISCPDSQNCNSFGSQVVCKEEYLNSLNPVDQSNTQEVGHPYLYFQNSLDIPFQQAQVANRMSLYVNFPSGITVGAGGGSQPPIYGMNIGPFNGGTNHWYHKYPVEGGSWGKIIVDSHPQHNNAWNKASHYPYPSKSMRNMGRAYFNATFKFYITFNPYEGFNVPPFDAYFDKIEYYDDPEPQNLETISSLVMTFQPELNYTFNLGWNDKYKGNAKSFSTYEIRYSYNAITNANWNSATPVIIQPHAGFHNDYRTDGKVSKWRPHFQQVFCQFKLQESRSQLDGILVNGKKLYFAMKDISQNTTDLRLPIDSIDNFWTYGGRDYLNYNSTFDFSGDSAVLHLIYRWDFMIPFNDTQEITSTRVSLYTFGFTTSFGRPMGISEK